MDKIKKYTAANRLAWNEAMPLHQKANKSKWDDLFSRSGFSVIRAPELSHIQSLELKDKTIAHLCCNNGVELMSLINMGASLGVGFDISDVAIAEAGQRADKFGINCKFVQSDVYEISEDYNGLFDIVYLSIGCLGWLPDLKAFFDKVSLLLKPSGMLFIHESHPFTVMLPADDQKDVNPLLIIEPYFKSEPYVESAGIDYIGKTTYKSEPMYWFVWTLSDIFNSLIKNGFRLEHFSEYPEDISTQHKRTEEAQAGIPLSYILMARKQVV